jgi:hypothetical protein
MTATEATSAKAQAAIAEQVEEEVLNSEDYRYRSRVGVSWNNLRTTCSAADARFEAMLQVPKGGAKAQTATQTASHTQVEMPAEAPAYGITLQ